VRAPVLGLCFVVPMKRGRVRVNPNPNIVDYLREVRYADVGVRAICNHYPTIHLFIYINIQSYGY